MNERETVLPKDDEQVMVREFDWHASQKIGLNPFALELVAESFALGLQKAAGARWFTIIPVPIAERKGESPVYVTVSRTSPKELLESAQQSFGDAPTDDVETAARAIYQVMRERIEDGGFSSSAWFEQSPEGRDECRAYAEAALRSVKQALPVPQVRALVAQWRKQALHLHATMRVARAAELRQCADELEGALNGK